MIVTTDKVYRPSKAPRAEDHPVGAAEPYGASKAAVELAVEAWRQAYFPVPAAGRQGFPRVALATARSGNVIGGGDWARDRLVPDCVRALRQGGLLRCATLGGQAVAACAGPACRVSDARPPGSGAPSMAVHSGRLAELSGAFNFGPAAGDHHRVREVVAEVLKRWPGKWRGRDEPTIPSESRVLRLDARKAHRLLGWRPRWRFARAVDMTVAWYQGASSPSRALELTLGQLAEYTSARR